MNVKEIVIIFTALFGSLICNAQSVLTNGLVVQKRKSFYGVDNSKNSNVCSISYKLYNESDDVIWLWIEKDDLAGLSDSIKAKSYFYKRKGDFSLYDLALDGNVASFSQSIFSVFVKCVEPKEHFTIQIISNKDISETYQQKVFQFLDRHIVAISEKSLSRYVYDIKSMDERIFFKEEFISLFLDSLF
ncbi:hypothetical protein [Bacteroides sedimenti]|uniref:Uncharacterized protein n=1 Tax=Bacteroides sedimenti TaxID=2136147 RepID=A0ABM8IAS4_9BACE